MNLTTGIIFFKNKKNEHKIKKKPNFDFLTQYPIVFTKYIFLLKVYLKKPLVLIAEQKIYQFHFLYIQTKYYNVDF